jgi:curved DNA-binding protein CbpA
MWDISLKGAGYDAVSRAARGDSPTRRRQLKDMGHRLLTKEALDVLALRPGATSVEIKEAYRDMVKVWHPDRFGSDPRLRQKAEDNLKQINKAYQVLQAGSGTSAAEPERAASSTTGGASSPRSSSSSPIPRSGRARPNRVSVGVGWLYGCVGIALGLIAGYVALEHGALQVARLSPASAQQVEASSELTEPKIPATQTSRVDASSDDVNSSAELPGRDDQPKDSGRSNRSASAQFHVRQLSGAETDQMESACSALKDQAAYQTCVKAQLDLITNASGQPDLSALNGAERESIESACSEVNRLLGPGGYNRCLTAQMAELAAEPARPDLSGLNDADRSSIEAACRKAKYREGPSAYNRCRAGLIKLLAESK